MFLTVIDIRLSAERTRSCDIRIAIAEEMIQLILNVTVVILVLVKFGRSNTADIDITRFREVSNAIYTAINRVCKCCINFTCTLYSSRYIWYNQLSCTLSFI